MRLDAKGFTDPIYLLASAGGAAFFPVLPNAFGTVYSRNDDLPNAIFVSKLGEPEAVPIVNFLLVGSANKEILAIRALRDSVIILKEDGVFRLVGDAPGNFTVTAVDNTVICQAPHSVQVLNNQVVFLSNQGVCLVTESAVQIISRKIEDVIQPILGYDTLAAQTFAVAYETERMYLISTILPGETTNTAVYAYNILNDAWSRWDTMFSAGTIGPRDMLYLVTTGNKIHRERKSGTRLDYSGQNTTVTVVSVGTLIATITSSVAPVAGDVLNKSDTINRISTVTFAGGSNYNLTFARTHNLQAADSVILYKAYTATIRMAPFHAGLVGRTKQFSQCQIHMHDQGISRALLSFVTNYFGGSENTNWSLPSTGIGWGFEPWGFFSWGEGDATNIDIETKPSRIIRFYIPRFAHRATWIQLQLQHSEAVEALNIQALAYTVRAYGDRTSR
jgi:hypothetical protein